MTQSSALRALDARILTALRLTGLKDAATFTQAGGGTPTACTVLVNRGLQAIANEFGQVTSEVITIDAFVAEISTRPLRGATFVIGSETFTVDAVQSEDESRVVCIVKPGS